MNPAKVVREKTHKLTDLPNIGKSIAADLESIDIYSPNDLKDKDPFALYERLCDKNGTKIDPCVIDVFMSITDFINGGEPKVWWKYTSKRKEMLTHTTNKS
jgi:hypothetical protein